MPVVVLVDDDEDDSKRRKKLLKDHFKLRPREQLLHYGEFRDGNFAWEAEDLFSAAHVDKFVVLAGEVVIEGKTKRPGWGVALRPDACRQDRFRRVVGEERHRHSCADLGRRSRRGEESNRAPARPRVESPGAGAMNRIGAPAFSTGAAHR